MTRNLENALQILGPQTPSGGAGVKQHFPPTMVNTVLQLD